MRLMPWFSTAWPREILAVTWCCTVLPCMACMWGPHRTWLSASLATFTCMFDAHAWHVSCLMQTRWLNWKTSSRHPSRQCRAWPSGNVFSCMPKTWFPGWSICCSRKALTTYISIAKGKASNFHVRIQIDCHGDILYLNRYSGPMRIGTRVPGLHILRKSRDYTKLNVYVDGHECLHTRQVRGHTHAYVCTQYICYAHSDATHLCCA
jgi:hypothetical protein